MVILSEHHGQNLRTSGTVPNVHEITHAVLAALQVPSSCKVRPERGSKNPDITEDLPPTLQDDGIPVPGDGPTEGLDTCGESAAVVFMVAKDHHQGNVGNRRTNRRQELCVLLRKRRDIPRQDDEVWMGPREAGEITDGPWHFQMQV